MIYPGQDLRTTQQRKEQVLNLQKPFSKKSLVCIQTKTSKTNQLT